MLPILASLLRFALVLLIELVVFFAFYNRPDGRKAVYTSWYAWIIDVLAIFSGSTIMFWSVYSLHNPHLFTVALPAWIFWIGFLIGSWQAGIHLVKLVIRAGKSGEEK